jgi:hypothetical protein
VGSEADQDDLMRKLISAEMEITRMREIVRLLEVERDDARRAASESASECADLRLRVAAMSEEREGLALREAAALTRLAEEERLRAQSEADLLELQKKWKR